MFVYCALILYLNNRKLPRPLRPSRWRNLAMTATFIFFGVFGYLTLRG
jgi:hypothetical protein